MDNVEIKVTISVTKSQGYSSDLKLCVVEQNEAATMTGSEIVARMVALTQSVQTAAVARLAPMAMKIEAEEAAEAAKKAAKA